MKFPFIDNLIDSGGDCYLIGGAVRDSFMNLAPSDFDFVVRNLSVIQLLNVCSEFGASFMHKYISGAIRLHTKDFGIVDISTPRVGISEYSPSGTVLQHMSFFDFTMNCLSMDMKTSEIENPYGGIEDIQKKLIVLNPNYTSLEFNPILPLRAARFMSTFGFTVDDRTKAIFHNDKDMLFTIPIDRLKFEIYRVLTTSNYQAGVSLLEELGILKRILLVYNQ